MSASELDLVPLPLDDMDFVFSRGDGYCRTYQQCLGRPSLDIASDTDCNNGACAPWTVTSVAAIATVDTLQVYLGSSELSKNFGWQLDTMEAAILKLALEHVQGLLDRFFQKQ